MEDATLLLGVIAAATAVMAVVQVGMFVCGLLLSRRVNRLIEVVEQEMRPVVDRVGTLSDDAARLSSLAVARIERVDRAFERITRRLEETMKAAQDAVVEPARQGMLLAHVLRAGLAALRNVKERPPAAADARPQDGVGAGSGVR
ncbi:MAG: hypothetical protein OXF93_24050 [Acidobacteria bacterium]|nr:hypothetical protein [Acidobacteriota bacterium]